MATTKKHSLTAAAAVKAMVNASLGTISPPDCVKLRDGDMVFWNAVVCARARDEWSEAHLIVAGQLARCLHDIEREQVALDAEGTIAVNDKGTQIVNPRVSVLEQFARREMALMRTLSMGGYTPGKDQRSMSGTRKLERQSRSVKDELADELLA
jgi:hypothetical protein